MPFRLPSVLQRTSIVRDTIAPFLLSLILIPAAHAGPACDTARTYSRMVQQQRYDLIGTLFAQHGVWFAPTGAVHHGPEAIGKAFQDYLGERRPDFHTDNYVDGGRLCVMEVSMKVKTDGTGKVVLGSDGTAAILPIGSQEKGIFVRRAIDHFTVNAAGKIERMIVYNAPTSYWR